MSQGRRTMTRATVTASVLMFGVPFLLLAACYAALPVAVPVLLNPLAGTVLLAPKSVFAVFRVPFMNLTHGLMAAMMLSRTRDFEDVRRGKAYSGIFLTFLFTIALKADFEALAMCGLAWSFGTVAPWLTGGGAGVGSRWSWPGIRAFPRRSVTLAGTATLHP